MNRLSIGAIIVAATLVSAPGAFADELGRYSMALAPAMQSLVLLDTATGQTWRLTQNRSDEELKRINDLQETLMDLRRKEAAGDAAAGEAAAATMLQMRKLGNTGAWVWIPLAPPPPSSN
jgi:hypothetical protein